MSKFKSYMIYGVWITNPQQEKEFFDSINNEEQEEEFEEGE